MTSLSIVAGKTGFGRYYEENLPESERAGDVGDQETAGEIQIFPEPYWHKYYEDFIL